MCGIFGSTSVVLNSLPTTLQSQNTFLRVYDYVLGCPESAETSHIVPELVFCTANHFPRGVVPNKCVMAKERSGVSRIQVVGTFNWEALGEVWFLKNDPHF